MSLNLNYVPQKKIALERTVFKSKKDEFDTYFSVEVVITV